MNPLGVLLILPSLLFGVHALPSISRRHHVQGRFGAHLTSRLNLQQEHDLMSNTQTHHLKGPNKDVRILTLNDPLDCLSQVVCGLNTYPPKKPNVRSNTANDFAYLLKNSIAKLRSSQPPSTTTTTTTVAPATKRTTTKAPLNDEDDDSDEDVDYEEEEVADYYDGRSLQDGHNMHRRSKRYSIFNKRRGEPAKKSKKNAKKGRSNGKRKNKQNSKKFRKSTTPRPLTALDRLRMETDLRAKLLSEAQCINGIQDHRCPFNYPQMLVLISSALERERTISFTADRVLPMVGYLLKSRNYTGTLQATFTSIEKINNYTIEADKEGKPIDFTHILDEVMNRQTGDNGLRIVDTSNDSASASVWEDDEFEHVLQNPYERRRPSSDNYKLDKKKKEEQKKQKKKGSEQAAEDDQSVTSEEDTSEEGLVFDRRRPPPNGPGDGESSSEEDDANQEDNTDVVEKGTKQKKKISVSGLETKSMAPGAVFGFGHLQKSAEDE